MSVAKCLGVDDIEGPNMNDASSQWPHWRQDQQALPIVDDLRDLPRWMRKAEPAERDAVLSALLRLGASDKRAAMVLAWLLVPGASLLAGRLRNIIDVIDVIDEVVAGQLWIQICDHDPSDDTYVAKKILSRVEREAKAELGVGDLAERRDPAWAATVWSSSSMSPPRLAISPRSSITRGSSSLRSSGEHSMTATCRRPVAICCLTLHTPPIS